MKRSDFEFGFVVVDGMIQYNPDIRDKGMTVGEILNFIWRSDVWPTQGVLERLADLANIKDTGLDYGELFIAIEKKVDKLEIG